MVWPITVEWRNLRPPSWLSQRGARLRDIFYGTENPGPRRASAQADPPLLAQLKNIGGNVPVVDQNEGVDGREILKAAEGSVAGIGRVVGVGRVGRAVCESVLCASQALVCGLWRQNVNAVALI